MSARLDPKLVARKLAVNRRLLCAAPIYLERRGTPQSIDDLAGHDCVLFPPMTLKGAWAFARNDQRYVVSVVPRFETDDMATAHAAIRSGMALGVLPHYIAADDLRLGRLVSLLPDYQLVPEADIYLVHLPNLMLPLRVRALIGFLEQRFKAGLLWEQSSSIP